MSEHQGEPVRGLPEPLPDGETLLWQGAPLASALARRTFHTRMLAAYFLLLVVWRFATVSGPHVLRSTAVSLLWIGLMAFAATGFLMLLSWLISRTTVYTITSRRLVIRFGIALPMTVNIPFRVVDAAGLRTYGDGSGDIPLRIVKTERVSYAVLWPHVRPFRIARAEPMLRCIPQAASVAQILGRALAAANGVAVSATPELADATTAPGADLRPRASAAA